MRPSFFVSLPLLALLLAAATTAAAGPEGKSSPKAVVIIDAMVEAHGGLEKWASAPSVQFVEEWAFPGTTTTTKSRIHVEQGPRRATIDNLDSTARIAWDGEKAWSVDWEARTPPRFLALLNYHFANLPWLSKDPGVILGEPTKRTLWDDPKQYVAVRISYETGVGDTPKDYYELFIDPETHRLHATEYIVTYKALLPPGVESTPARILVYDTWETVDGLLVPTHFTSRNDDESVYAECSFRDWSFDKAFDESRLVMPENGVVDTSQP